MDLVVFALDYFAGPGPVLATLCAEKKLHQSGLLVKERSDEASFWP